jgi:hypothetical protein
MKFKIQPLISGKAMIFDVEKTEETPTTETYVVSARGHSITIQNNRRLFRQKGLKHRKGWWKVLQGNFRNESAKEAICQAIERADPE